MVNSGTYASIFVHTKRGTTVGTCECKTHHGCMVDSAVRQGTTVRVPISLNHFGLDKTPASPRAITFAVKTTPLTTTVRRHPHGNVSKPKCVRLRCFCSLFVPARTEIPTAGTPVLSTSCRSRTEPDTCSPPACRTSSPWATAPAPW